MANEPSAPPQPTKPKQYKNNNTLLIWAGIALFLIFIHLRLFPYAEDDAYIHFRIARNFITYGLPNFNPGEAVYASSAISWTLLVSLLFKLIAPIPQLIAIVNSLITTAGAMCYKKFLEKTTNASFPPTYYWIGVVFYLSAIALASIGLMETPLAFLLLFAGLLFWLDRNPLCFVLFGVMVFTRLELVVFFGLILIYSLLEMSFSYRKIFLGSLTGVLPFIAFALHFWGTLIPNTLLAKQLVYSLSPLNAISIAVNLLFPNVFSWQAAIIYKLAYLAVLLILVAHFIFSTEIRMKAKDENRFLAYLLLLSGLIILAAYVWRKVLIFGWYVPLYMIPAGLGLYRIIFLNSGWPRWFLIAITLPWAFTVCGNASQIVTAVVTNNPAFYPNFDSGARVRKYLQVGATLYQQYPNAKFMTSEIGGLGYQYEGYIFDGAGLVSPEALQFHPMKIPDERSGQLGAIPLGFVELVNPDIIVAYDGFVESFSRSEVADQYIRISEPIFLEDDLQRSESKEIWGNVALYVFIKRGLAEESQQP